jgi:signal transduction histidine kinase/sugar lactone lactonase YvrE
MNGISPARACRLLFSLCLLLLLAGRPAAALESKIALTDYHHDVWTAKDDAPQEVTSMAQTRDGWLWIGGISGLYRFDGIRFKRFEALAGELPPRPAVTALTALPDGDLLVGHLAGGISRIHQGHTVHYPATVGSITIGKVNSSLVDQQGTLWLASSSGLLKLRDGIWHDAGGAMGLPAAARVGKLLLDQYGKLWVAAGDALYVRDTPGGRLRRVLGAAPAVNLGLAPDGRLWLDTHDKLIQVPLQHPEQAPAPPTWTPQRTDQESGLFDRDGNYWALGCPVGLCRYPGGTVKPGLPLAAPESAADRLDQPWQMSSLNANVLFEDRDGSLWVGTQSGVERLRHNRLVPAPLRSGDRRLSMASDERGNIWLLAQPSGRLWQLLPNGEARLERTLEAPYAGVLGSAADGALLIPGASAIERRYQGRSEFIPYPPGTQDSAAGRMIVRLLDDGVQLWASIANKGTFRLKDGRWTSTSELGFPRGIFFTARAAKGAAWFGFREGTALYYDNGRSVKYGAEQGLDVGGITFLNAGPEVLAGGDAGLAVLQGGRFRRLLVDDPDVITSVSGMVIGANGDRWLNGSRGVVFVKAADWTAALASPDISLAYTLYGVLDGYPGLAATFSRLPSALGGAGGQLWFLGSDGVTRLDTAAAPPQQLPPQVKIENLVAQGRSYAALSQQLTLPPGTNAFRIEYTALSYLRPELLRFRYRLEGIDADWQAAGTRRAISYNNLGPGSYRFRVAAVNEEGQWSVDAAALSLRIEPTFVQTPFFYGLCVLLALGVVYGLYLLRMKQLTLLIGERMAERERIARALHDTFLQSVHTLILHFDAALTALPRESGTRGKMERVLALAERVMAEGRDQVHDLRSSGVLHGDLRHALEMVGELLLEQHSGHFSVLHVGQPVALQPHCESEIYNIGREALSNAFRHAAAGAIQVELRYEDEGFTLCVNDNGKGMPAEVLDGRQPAGRWGVPGMIERAERIGASLAIDSAEGNGTRLTVMLPARLAYARPVRRKIWTRTALFG